LGEPPGWFGKLAMLGDFAHRRLPPGVVQRCDEWLSQGVARSRQQLGDAWLDAYLNAPVWAFACAPRVIDTAWWFGVLMPSVDAAGRYFPLLVTSDAERPPTDAAALAALSRWYAAAADSALATLQPRATVDGFEAQLAALGSPPADASTATVDEHSIDVADTARWLEHAPAIALRAVADTLEGSSLWWPLPRGDASPTAARVNIVRGLPATERFAGLLQGQLDPHRAMSHS
jgi:type VI secretion system protein ImpM